MKKSGFTLIELLSVIVILGILLFISVPSITKILNNSKEKALKIDAKNFINITKKHYVLDNTDETKIYQLSDIINEQSISPYGSKYILENSFVIFDKTGNSSIFLIDESGHTVGSIKDGNEIFAVSLSNIDKNDVNMCTSENNCIAEEGSIQKFTGIIIINNLDTKAVNYYDTSKEITDYTMKKVGTSLYLKTRNICYEFVVLKDYVNKLDLVYKGEANIDNLSNRTFIGTKDIYDGSFYTILKNRFSSHTSNTNVRIMTENDIKSLVLLNEINTIKNVLSYIGNDSNYWYSAGNCLSNGSVLGNGTCPYINIKDNEIKDGFLDNSSKAYLRFVMTVDNDYLIYKDNQCGEELYE